MVILDDLPLGPYAAIWERLSHPWPVRKLRSNPFPEGTCLHAAIVPPFVGDLQSLLTQNAGSASEVFCPSTVLVATAMWLRHLFKELLPGSNRSPGTSHSQQLAPELQPLDSSAAAAVPSATRQPKTIGSSQTRLMAGLSPQHAASEGFISSREGPDGSAGFLKDRSDVGSMQPARQLPLGHSPRTRSRVSMQSNSQFPFHGRATQDVRHHPAFSRHRRGKGAHDAKKEESHVRHLQVLWISRAHQEQQQGVNMTSWQRARVVANEGALIAGLTEAVSAWNSRACLAGKAALAAECLQAGVQFNLKVSEREVREGVGTGNLKGIMMLKLM